MYRSKQITVRVTSDELVNIKDSAHIAGTTVAGFVRRMCAGTVDFDKRQFLRDFSRRAERQYDNWIRMLNDLENFLKIERKALR